MTFKDVLMKCDDNTRIKVCIREYGMTFFVIHFKGMFLANEDVEGLLRKEVERLQTSDDMLVVTLN